MTAPASQHEPWCRDAAEVAAELRVDVDHGLSSAEAAARLERFGRNELPGGSSARSWRRLLAQFEAPDGFRSALGL